MSWNERDANEDEIYHPDNFDNPTYDDFTGKEEIDYQGDKREYMQNMPPEVIAELEKPPPV
jgi:hypothetical protein